jgi:chromatin segregation and condensation protein Rec8/ScpA/Scc1 (kleisin family)
MIAAAELLEDREEGEDFQQPAQDETQNILKSILEKESWEDVIYYIVSVENIDPWNVDLVRLTTSFLKFVRSAKDLDFRIPAKIVFVSAILLRLKSDYLSFFQEEDEAEKMLKEGKPFEELGIDPNQVQLGYPMKRIPKRQVTLEELMLALKAATKVKERRDVRRRLWTERAAANISVGENIEQRIERIFGSIESLIAKTEGGKVGFKDVVKDWRREKIVEHLLPVLHLEQEQKIETEQEEFFRDIFVKKKRAKQPADQRTAGNKAA